MKLPIALSNRHVHLRQADIEALFGAESIVPRIIYSLVGLCGLINIGILVMHLEED